MSLFLLLAQSRLPEITPAFFSSWIAVFLLLGGLIVMVLSGFAMSLTILEKLKAKKTPEVTLTQDPMRVQKVAHLATRSELEEISGRIEADIKEVKDVAGKSASEQEARIVLIHNRVNKMAEGLDFMRGSLTEIANNQRLLMEKLLK